MEIKKLLETEFKFIEKNLGKDCVKLKNKKFLITGGSGFLGYYIVNFLNYLNDKKNYKIKISVIDNSIRGKKNWIKLLIKQKKIHFKDMDISKFKNYGHENYHYIMHAASIASPTYYRKFPLETIFSNILGLKNLLEPYKKNKKNLKKFLFFSSSEIYGNPDRKNLPTKETYNGNVSCIGPRASYDESKRLGETLCYNYFNKFKIPVVSVRPFNNYGPGMFKSDKRVLADFTNNILSKKDLVMYSRGNDKRTFCYISDAIIGYFKVLLIGKLGEVYNIGNNKPEITIKQLAKKFSKISQKLYGFKPRLIFKKSKDQNYLIDNPQRRCPDLKKSYKHLKYQPKIGLKEGITKTLIWNKLVNK